MSNKFICAIDKTEHETVDLLHKHLKGFSIKQEEYYKEYFPRYDLLTNEPIEFRSHGQYFSTNFVNKNNMKKWYKENPEKSKDLSIEMLKFRLKYKPSKKLPGEVELMSLGLPSSQYYYQFIKDRVAIEGFSPPYNYETKDFPLSSLSGDIIVDTREQNPYKFKHVKTHEGTLKFGDYSVLGRENEFVIERKSLADFLSSLVSGYDRLRREFERAKEAGAYIVLLCEESLNSALNYRSIPYFRKYTRVPPEVVFRNVRELIRDFDCQFLFCDGRVTSADVAIKLFRMKIEDVKLIDLQWAHSRAKIL